MSFRDLMQRLFSGGRELRQQLEQIESATLALSMEEARERMRVLLEDAEKYLTVRSTPEESAIPMLDGLPPTVRELYGEYERVLEQFGDTQLVRGEVGSSEYAPGFIRIGRAIDATELVVQSPDDAVYQVDGSEADVLATTRYPSIYHYLLVMARIIYPEAFDPAPDRR